MEEPLFKYGRLIADPGTLLGSLTEGSGPPAPGSSGFTCGALHPSFLALGTRQGTVVLLDLADGSEWKRLPLHKSPVTALAVDPEGSHLAAAADDGSTLVVNVLSDERSSHPHHKPVYGLDLAPEFTKQRDKAFVTGGATGKLWLLRKGFFGGWTEKLLHEGEGPVRCVAWCGNLVAWANDVGVKVMDAVRGERVCFVETAAEAPPPELCPCRLTWESPSCLLIAWGPEIRVVAIRTETSSGTEEGPASTLAPATAAPAPAGGPPDELAAAAPVRKSYGEVVARLYLPDAHVVGIAPFGPDLALLCYSLDEQRAATAAEGDSSTTSSAPSSWASQVELRVVARPPQPNSNSNTGAGAGSKPGQRTPAVVLAAEALPLAAAPGEGPDALLPSHLALLAAPAHVHGSGGLPVLVVVSPGDVLVAVPREPGDHVEALLGAGAQAAAVEAILAVPGAVADSRVRDVAVAYAHQLLESGQLGKALAAAATLLAQDAPACEGVVAAAFDAAGDDRQQLDVVTAAVLARFALATKQTSASTAPPVLPLLASSTYERALLHLLGTAPAALPAALRLLLGSSDEGTGKHAPPHRAPALTLPTIEALGARLLAALREQASPQPSTAASTATTPAPRGVLFEALLLLYRCGDLYEEAIELCLEELATRLRGDDTGDAAVATQLNAALWQLLDEHPALLPSVGDAHIPLLLVCNESRALALLLQHAEGAFPVERVVASLQAEGPAASPARLLAYLHALFTRAGETYNAPAYARFHELQLRLYVAHDRTSLLSFLQHSSYYPLELARQLCAAATPQPLHAELVYVLTREGNAKAALAILMEQLGDIPRAVQLAASFDDEDLWTELVRRTLATGSGEAVGQLLDQLVHTPLNSLRIIKEIPLALPIPDLAQRLLRLLRDQVSQRNLVTVCRDLVQQDVAALAAKRVRHSKQALRLAGQPVCAVCQEALSAAKEARGTGGGGGGSSGEIGGEAPAVDEGGEALTSPPAALPHAPTDAAASVIFFCGHASHVRCLAAYSGGRRQQQQLEAAFGEPSASRRGSFLGDGSGLATPRRSRSASSSGWTGGLETPTPRGRQGSMSSMRSEGSGGVPLLLAGYGGATPSGAAAAAATPGGGWGTAASGMRSASYGPSTRVRRRSSLSSGGLGGGEDGGGAPRRGGAVTHVEPWLCPVCNSGGRPGGGSDD